MSTAVVNRVGFDLLLRDLRHTEARAASDLADWLVHLDLEGKADRTLYGYTRTVAAAAELGGAARSRLCSPC